MAIALGIGFTADADRGLREDRGRMKQRAVMFAAIEAVAKPDPTGLAGRDKPHPPTSTQLRHPS